MQLVQTILADGVNNTLPSLSLSLRMQQMQAVTSVKSVKSLKSMKSVTIL